MITQTNTRMTNQRKTILETVRNMHTHATADEIYQSVREKLPKISLGTVYRNLDLLVSQGRLKRLDFSGAQRRYDGNLHFHYHMKCVACGKVVDAPMDPITDMEMDLREKTDFEIFGYELEFFGLCPICKKEKKQDRS